MKNVIIIGSGGHARVIVDIIEKSGDKVLGFLDQNRDPEEMVLGYPVLGSEVTDTNRFLKENTYFMIGVGDNRKRKMIAEELALPWYTAVHPASHIGKAVEVGEGTVVMANAVINPASVIGKHCIINTSASIDHDNRICDFAHISPNAALAGKVEIGEETHIGIGASVIEETQICAGVKVGAGAVVVKNITKKGVYVGVPAKLVKGSDGSEE